MSKPEDRSGLSPEWVGGLTDISAADCESFIADMQDMPLRDCEAPNCEDMATWLVAFHTCSRFAVCDRHRTAWTMGVAQSIQYNGSILCENCGLHGFSVESVMHWFTI